MDKVLDTLVRSSVNPEKVGMTARGLMLSFVPLVALLLNIDQAPLLASVDGLVQLIVAVLGIVSIGMVTYGSLRKVWVKAKNR